MTFNQAISNILILMCVFTVGYMSGLASIYHIRNNQIFHTIMGFDIRNKCYEPDYNEDIQALQKQLDELSNALDYDKDMQQINDMSNYNENIQQINNTSDYNDDMRQFSIIRMDDTDIEYDHDWLINYPHDWALKHEYINHVSAIINVDKASTIRRYMDRNIGIFNKPSFLYKLTHLSYYNHTHLVPYTATQYRLIPYITFYNDESFTESYVINTKRDICTHIIHITCFDNSCTPICIVATRHYH